MSQDRNLSPLNAIFRLLGDTEDFDDSQFEKSDVLSETMNLDETALTAWDSESESELDIE